MIARVLLAALVLFAGSALAQPWDGIIDPARAIDWSTAGVTGGIPTNRTQCGSTISAYTGTAGTINTAINNCGENQYVLLGAGTFNLSTGILFNGTNNVTLRGSGPDSTFLVFTGDETCTGFSWSATICVRGSDLGYYGPAPTYTTTWTAASYAQGQTQITVASAANMAVGRWLVLDQTDNASDPGTDIYVCNSVSCTDEGGTSYGRSGRQQRQWVKITAIDGTLVTFTPGLLAPNWASARSPGAYWGGADSLVYGVGIEDLSANALNSGAGAANITFIFAYDSWAKNVRLIYAPNPRAFVAMAWSHHITVRDSYMFGSVSMGSGQLHYGMETVVAQSNLIENNIVQARTSPFVSDGDVGSVWAYNYAINDYYYTLQCADPCSFMQASNYSHESGNFYVLHEGNDAVGIKGDIVHGTSNLFTFFRNYSRGYESGKTSAASAAIVHSYNRFWHFIGNVLGTDGQHTTYTSTSSRDNVIFGTGIAGNTVGADSVTTSTMMRWGNYDTVNDATRWESSEVPSGIAKYANAVPSTQTLPSSFYLSSKPAFFGSNSWPPIGPDVTGGSISGVGGHVKRIPARVCFEDVMGGAYADTTPKTFNANTCYAALLQGPGNPRWRPAWSDWQFRYAQVF